MDPAVGKSPHIKEAHKEDTLLFLAEAVGLDVMSGTLQASCIHEVTGTSSQWGWHHGQTGGAWVLGDTMRPLH